MDLLASPLGFVLLVVVVAVVGIGLGLAGGLGGVPSALAQAAKRVAGNAKGRILVVFEWFGGNDGLNTVVISICSSESVSPLRWIQPLPRNDPSATLPHVPPRARSAPATTTSASSTTVF